MTPMRKLTGILAGLALLPASAQALPLMDVEVEGRYWYANPSGDMAYGDTKQDVADDLGFSKEWSPNLYARVALPLITVDVEQTQLSYSGKVEKSVDWQGTTYTASEDTELTLDLTHAGVMFNPVPLPMVDIGVGLGATRIGADAKVATESTTGNFTLPVAKLEARVNPPVLPLQFIARGNGLVVDGNGYTDIVGEVAFATGAVQFRAGYRRIQFKADPDSSLYSDNLYVDTTFSGPFAGLAVAF